MIKGISIRTVGKAALAALVVTTAPKPAAADLHTIVIPTILCEMTNCRGNPRPGPRPPRPRYSAEQLQQNRDVQSSLNAFGWNVGSVDGVPGRRTRAGISQYEMYMGWDPDGRLTDFERQTLVNGWRQYQAGAGHAYPNMMQREGARGLLKTALNPNYPQQFGDGGVMPRNPAPLPGPGNGQTLDTQVFPDIPEEVPGTSVASRCQIVALRMEANMGPIEAANLTDPDQALSEQFCDAVSFSMAKSNGRLASLNTPEAQIASACDRITASMKPVIGTLSGGDVAGPLTRAAGVAQELGLSTQNAQAYGEICVGLGYRRDDAAMSLASGLLLTGVGYQPYGELVGHHLREGFGIAPAPSAAKGWYTTAITALEEGAAPVFQPGTTRERVNILRKSIEVGGLQAGALGTLPPIVPAGATLPPLQ